MNFFYRHLRGGEGAVLFCSTKHRFFTQFLWHKFCFLPLVFYSSIHRNEALMLFFFYLLFASKMFNFNDLMCICNGNEYRGEICKKNILFFYLIEALMLIPPPTLWLEFTYYLRILNWILIEMFLMEWKLFFVCVCI